MTTITKSFQFDGQDASTDDDKPDVVLEVGKERFQLKDDLLGLELLRYIAITSGGVGSTQGIVRLFERVVPDDDWKRFIDVTDRYRVKPEQWGEMAGQVIDAYASFPTTRGAGSSGGSSTTGSTSE